MVRFGGVGLFPPSVPPSANPRVSGKLRLLSVAAGSFLLLLVGFLAGVYWASQRVPEFYAQAVQLDPEQAQVANDELLAGATALASNARKEGDWSAVFTAEQINGWLAVDLPQNYPDMLPLEVIEPRVEITPKLATIGCRYKDGAVTTVISVAVELYLAEPNVVALRIHGIHAGAVPIPLSQVLDGINEAAEQMKVQLRWTKAKGDPVALVTIPPAEGSDDTRYRLEALEMRAGELYVSGHTFKATHHEPRAGAEHHNQRVVADQPGSKVTSHR